MVPRKNCNANVRSTYVNGNSAPTFARTSSAKCSTPCVCSTVATPRRDSRDHAETNKCHRPTDDDFAPPPGQQPVNFPTGQQRGWWHQRHHQVRPDVRRQGNEDEVQHQPTPQKSLEPPLRR